MSLMNCCSYLGCSFLLNKSDVFQQYSRPTHANVWPAQLWNLNINNEQWYMLINFYSKNLTMYFRLSFLNLQVKDSDKSNVSFDTQYHGHKLNSIMAISWICYNWYFNSDLFRYVLILDSIFMYPIPALTYLYVSVKRPNHVGHIPFILFMCQFKAYPFAFTFWWRSQCVIKPGNTEASLK